MSEKLNCILLVDDDEATNFVHQMVLEEVEVAEKIDVVRNGEEALDYLNRQQEEKYPCPDLVFLDINMPVMNGWEFLEAYQKIESERRGRIIVVMLTTSMNPDDKTRAEAIAEIDDYEHKPLTEDKIQAILAKHFAEKE